MLLGSYPRSIAFRNTAECSRVCGPSKLYPQSPSTRPLVVSRRIAARACDASADHQQLISTEGAYTLLKAEYTLSSGLLLGHYHVEMPSSPP